MNKYLIKRVLSILTLIIVLSSVTVAPVVAATTYNVYAFGWSKDILDGYKNGKTYSLRAGTAILRTTGTITDAPDYYLDNVQYTVELRKHNWWWLPTSLGKVSQTATRYGKSNYASWNAKSDGTYSLYFVKPSATQNIVTLSVGGTLTN